MSADEEGTSEPQNENNSLTLFRNSSLCGDDRFLARLLSRDSVLPSSSSSSRSYYRECGQVPFAWESSPGKPKCPPASEGSVPPLSPPPAAQVTSCSVHDQHEAARARKAVELRRVEGSYGCLVKPFKPLFASVKRWGFL